MPVTFHTPSHAAVVYTNDVGVAMLKLMGRTGNVPGALDAEHVSVALDTLRQRLEAEAEAERGAPAAEASTDDDAAPIGAGTRAFPLVELLEAAIDAGDYVSWD